MRELRQGRGGVILVLACKHEQDTSEQVDVRDPEGYRILLQGGEAVRVVDLHEARCPEHGGFERIVAVR